MDPYIFPFHFYSKKMAFALSQQAKGSSLLLLLLLVLILFLELPSPTTSGHCQQRCDSERYNGDDAGVVFHCIAIVETAECESDCKSCPKHICDDSFTPIKFNCPAIDDARCEKHCDDNRPIGINSAYTLDCQKKYTTNTEIKRCQSHCEHCEEDICDLDDPHIYNCDAKSTPKPTTTTTTLPPPVIRTCEDRCNNRRPKGSQEAFKLKCATEYSTTKEVEECKEQCKDCHSDICDPSQGFEIEYNCPFLKLTRRCDDFCNANRRFQTLKTPEAYEFQCYQHYTTVAEKAYCKSYCRDCPEEICNPNDPYEYKCPAINVSSVEEPVQNVDEEPGNKQLATLAIVGIVLGILLLVLIIGAVIYFVIRKKKAKNQVVPEGPGQPISTGYQSPITPEPTLSSASLPEPISSTDFLSADMSFKPKKSHKKSKKK